MRHHDHGISHTKTNLIEACLYSEVYSIIITVGSMVHIGRHGAGKVTECSTSRLVSINVRESLNLVFTFETSRPSPLTHILQQGHTS